MNNFIKFLSSFLFVHNCSFCKKGLKYNDNTYICKNCRTTLPYIEHACIKCGRQTGEHAVLICADCRRYKEKFSGAYIPLRYEGTVKSAVLRMKFSNSHFIARAFALLIAEKIVSSPIPELEFITFVPISPEDSLTRGYNQSEITARFLAGILNIPVKETLIRRPGTKRQSSLAGKDRRKNAKNSFVKMDMKLSGSVLLVDDILTTGATMSACTNLLLEMGCEKVYIAACCANCK